MNVPILRAPEHHWACPNCSLTSISHEPRAHVQMHPCAGLAGLTAPMVPAAERGTRVIAVERQDYLGADQGRVRLDGNGRPVMSVVTERADGSTDAVVFAPTATASA